MMHIKNPSFFSAPLVLALTMSLTACDSGDGEGESSTGLVTTETGDTAADGTDGGSAESGDADSTGTDATGTDSSGTDSSGSDTGTDTTGTDTSGTDTSGTDTSGTDTGSDTSGTTGDGDCSMDPGWGPLQMGSQVKHIEGTNYDGSAWNMGDWCGTKIGFDVSAVWCGPCQLVSACLGGSDSDCGQIFGGSYGPDLRSRIGDDSIKWVTFLTQNQGGSASAVSDAAAWDSQYHNEKIPVIVPNEHSQVEMYSPEFFPSIHALDEGMRFAAIDDGQTWGQLDFLLQ